MDITKIELDTHDGKSLQVCRWDPLQENAKGVVHILHGMAEHKFRYLELIKKFCDQHYIVYAHDHRGHGESIELSELAGHFGDGESWQDVIKDVKTVQDHIQSQHKDVPATLLGHSMGSFIATHYTIEHGNHLSALVLTGTAAPPKFPETLLCQLAAFEVWRLGERTPGQTLENLTFASYNKAFKPARTDFDWLTREDTIVDQYIDDKYCGFTCTTRTWQQLAQALLFIGKDKNTKKVKSDLPIYIVCGDQDPVGKFGKAIPKLQAHWLKAGIKTVDVKLVSEGRHEVLNETNREDIHEELLSWINQKIS